jgi:hypothetical protein
VVMSVDDETGHGLKSVRAGADRVSPSVCWTF